MAKMKLKKYAEGTSSVSKKSMTGKTVVKAKPVSPAYLPSKDVKVKGGDALSYSKGGDPMKDTRNISTNVSGVGMTKVKKYKDGGTVGKNVRKGLPDRAKVDGFKDPQLTAYAQHHADNVPLRELKEKKATYGAAGTSPYSTASESTKRSIGQSYEAMRQAVKAKDKTQELQREYITQTIAPKKPTKKMSLKKG